MRRMRPFTSGAIALAVATVIFVLPFVFIALQAVKSKSEASRLDFTLPQQWLFWDNLAAVFQARDYQLVLAYFNSTLITVVSVTILILLSAMVGYVMQRRKTRWNAVASGALFMGLMMPPAVVPTIGLLQEIGLFKTITGMILIQVAYNLSFSILLYRAFISTIPRDLDEAALIDGAKPWQIFFRVILPLLKPVTVTNIVVQSIAIFNDFTNPLYYLPGKENVTVQLTLYNFQSMYTSQYNLLFMNILLVTVPPLIVFIFFNRQIVAGMTAGAVKG
ncbi:carbohydrate ABC transporter permease [Rhizobium sp. SEMIA 4085]|uniref:sn-glycerol-3-phosphate transport system permease protein UgpE n=1 Tax=Rhizobium gallicum bv. gallicum R602sp TaxID=1041138 RepID=A0A0B4XEH8_9HYPH|nr:MULTISPECIES: carbohydrate ABC transporter permease [Rhizobium]AJD45486.1 sugar ABC transporter permease protein [Rhizobium gallicum bv. gallicum R602sp]NNH30133.1 carbohydrate ABC transporter permease [Rhizobium sp. SEMIA 4085]TDW32744.1 carbohydrate ABC transporter membrane protein 2 (CUT1 family) [Rhizobium azibense]